MKKLTLPIAIILIVSCTSKKSGEQVNTENAGIKTSADFFC
jgi:uncharacterized protein YcfL